MTLFLIKGLMGRAFVTSSSVRSMRDSSLGGAPASMQIGVNSDAVLLFKREEFKGDCIFRRRRQTIRELGSAREGGKSGFGNTVSSMRLDPFFVSLNVTVVQKSDGTLPGDWADEFFADIQIGAVVRRANDLLAAQQALLELQVDAITVRTDDQKFDLTERETKDFPATWKKKAMVDVIFVNSFAEAGVAGMGKFPLKGNVVVLSKTRNGEGLWPTDWMASALVHEFGHYLGLSHKTGAASADNIMSESGGTFDADGNLLFSQLFFDADQIEEMHNKLSQNLVRKNDRRSETG